MGAYLEIIKGWLLGAFSGLFPGIHLNTVVSILEGFGLRSAFLFGSLAGAQVISQFIPSMILAAPSEELALSVLPAQRLLQKGEAGRGVMAGLAGAVFGVLAFFVLMPASLIVLPWIYVFVYPLLGWFLILLCAYLVWSERRRFEALTIFILSSVFGLLVLDSAYPNSVKLFSMLTGCFGASTLFMGLLSEKDLPEQRISSRVSDLTLPGGLVGAFSGFLVGVFPAISCSQAVALFSPFLISEEAFISAVSSASISNILFSALTLTVLGKARNGLMAGLEHLEFVSALKFLGAFSIVLLPSVLLVFFLSRRILSFLSSFYKPVLCIVLSFLLLLSVYFGGWWGLMVFITSGALGVLTVALGVRRTQCMAMLILPTILFYI